MALPITVSMSTRVKLPNLSAKNPTPAGVRKIVKGRMA